MKVQILKILFSFAFVFIFININLNSQTNYNKQIDDLQFFTDKELIELKGDNINKKQTTKNSVTFTAMNVSGTAGNTVTIPINISDVTDLASFQFTIEYDNSQLTYNSCNSWLVPGSVTIQEPTPGHLTFVWAVATGSDYSAGLFFNLVMNIDASATGMIGILWSDDPTARLVGNSASVEIPSSWINGSVNVSGTTNPSLTIADVTTTQSSLVSVAVNATDLYDLCAFQWTINYDASRLTFNSCSNWASGIDGASVLINDNGSGTITFAYNNYPNGVNIINGKFFDLNFTTNTTTGVAPLTWSSTPTAQELSNSIPAVINATWNDGSVTISTTPTIIIETVNGVSGSPVSVPVDALNLTNLCAFQWTIDYDETKLTYTGCSNWATGINTDPSYLLINDDGSKITFAYNDYPNTVSIANGKFFDLNFTINATATGTAPIVWSDNPTPRELSDNVPNVITADWIDGAVIISPATSITIEEVFGIAGNPVTVPVKAVNLNNMCAFQWTIDYDETKLTYTGCSNWAIGINTDPSYLLINDDGTKITFAYNDYPNTVDIANKKFFDLNFTALAGSSGVAPVIWSDNPTPREVSDDVPNVITVIWYDGSVIFDLNWDGSESTDWQTVANWTPEYIPTSAVNAVIPAGCPNYPIIDDGATTAECLNLQIDANATVTIATNGQMTVHGTLTNNAGVSAFVVQSDATGDGSLIQNTIGVNATVQRFLPTAGSSEWHFFSSPITTAPTAPFGVGMYDYVEAQDDWWTGPNYYYNSTSGWSPVPTNMVVAEGYIWYAGQQTTSFQGVLNADVSYTMPASYNVHPGNAPNGNPYTIYDGWVLVGNPYPCALDWEMINISDDITTTVYYYDDDIDNYAYYQVGGASLNGGTRYIPSGQGFFIKTNDQVDGGSITIPNSARTHNDQLFWKNENTSEVIRLKVESGNYYDESLIVINDLASNDYMDNFDAFKHFSWNSNVPQVFSMIEDRTVNLAINTFDLPDDFRKIIPLGYKFPNAGQYDIKFTENNISNAFIIMHDNDNDIYTLMNNKEVYSVDVTNEINFERLELIIEKNVSPKIVSNIRDVQIEYNTEFSFSIPSDFYIDTNIFDKITVIPTTIDGNELPEWIVFDKETMTFSGKMISETDFVVLVNVVDMLGLKATEDFVIYVRHPLSMLESQNHNAEIYPVPADNYLLLNIDGQKTDYYLSITSVTGEVIFQNRYSNDNINRIDMSNISSGVYIITIKFPDNSTIVEKIIKK